MERIRELILFRMKEIRANVVMLSFLGYVSIVIILGFFFGEPEYIGKISSFMYVTLFLSAIGAAAFFLRTKHKYFRNSFLISYFGVILFLIGFNVTNVIFKSSSDIVISILIIVFLLYQMVYPFLNRPLPVSKN